MRFGVLGPLQVGGDGGEAAVTAARDRVVLAVLLLNPNRIVPADRLIDAVWGDDPPPTARGQLHTCVSRLRRAIGGVAACADMITTVPAGYSIRVAEDDLDALRFARLLADARTLLTGGDEVGARDCFRAALAIWRGPALAGITSRAVRDAAAGLDEQRSVAIEDRIAVELALGAGAELIGELTGLVGEHPYRERLRCQLMVALSRAGRRAEALACYREGRELLAGALGIEPGSALRAAHQSILTGEDRPGVAEGPVESPAGARFLPRPVSDFTGRHAEVERLANELTGVTARVVVVDGMAGSGKTALALHVAYHVADRFPEGQLFIDLHGHSDREPMSATAALAVLLGQLGVPARRIPSDLTERAALWRAELAGRRVLVVLDNASATAQVTPLLPAEGSASIVITSRRRLLGLDGVRPVSLDVLPPGEATDLLHRIVGDRVLAEPGAAADVVVRCGRLPLAIRIAGARLAHRPGWRVSDLVERLDDATMLLAELYAEDRSVADAFALSYTQLATEQQRVFRLLGVHPGEDFDAVSVAALADLALGPTRTVLDALVDAHLLREATPGRYRLHDLVREYAAQVVAGVETPEERSGALRRLLDFYLHTAVAAGRQLPHAKADQQMVDEGPPRPDLVELRASDGAAWFAAERANLRTLCALAAENGLHPYAWRLAHATWRYLFEQSYLEDIVSMHTRGLAAARAAGDDRAVATMLNYLSSAAYRSGDAATAIAHMRAALAIQERMGEVTLAQTITRANLSICYAVDRQLDRALAEATTVLRHREQIEVDLVVLGDALSNLGLINVMCRRYDVAVRVHRRHLGLARQTGDLHQLGRAIGQLGAARAELGEFGPAIRLLRLAVRLRARTSNEAGRAESLNQLGRALARVGSGEESRRCHDEALALMRARGDRWAETGALNDSGESMMLLGHVELAMERHREALAAARLAGVHFERARALAGLGACLARTDPAMARDHYTEALHIFRDRNVPEQHDVVAALKELDEPRPG